MIEFVFTQIIVEPTRHICDSNHNQISSILQRVLQFINISVQQHSITYIHTRMQIQTRTGIHISHDDHARVVCGHEGIIINSCVLTTFIDFHWAWCGLWWVDGGRGLLCVHWCVLYFIGNAGKGLLTRFEWRSWRVCDLFASVTGGLWVWQCRFNRMDLWCVSLTSIWCGLFSSFQSPML